MMIDDKSFIINYIYYVLIKLELIICLNLL